MGRSRKAGQAVEIAALTELFGFGSGEFAMGTSDLVADLCYFVLCSLSFRELVPKNVHPKARRICAGISRHHERYE